MLNLDSVNQFSPQVLHINSPRSLEAVRSEGLSLGDLVYAETRGVAREVGEMRAKQWRKRWAEVREARNRLLAKGETDREKQAARSALLFESVSQSISHLREKERLRLSRLHAARQRLLPLPSPTPFQPSSKPTPTSVRSVQSKGKAKAGLVTSEPQAVARFELVERPANPVELSDSLPATIRRVQRLIAAREEEKRRSIEPATPSEASPQPSPALYSLNSSAKVTSVSPSCDSESRERRHFRVLQSLDSSRKAKLQEKRILWQRKLAKVRETQADQLVSSETRRVEQELTHIRAQSRFEAAFTQKDAQIQQTLALDWQRQQQSRLRRAHFEDKNSKKAAQLEANLRELEQRTQEKREFLLNQRRTRLKMREKQRVNRSLEAAQLHLLQQQQSQALEHITAEAVQYQVWKCSKDQELQEKQRLRKQLEAEKWELSESLERQRVQRQRSLRKGWDSVSPSPALLSRQGQTPSPGSLPV